MTKDVRKCLIVDDDPLWQTILKQQVEPTKCDVRIVASREKAWDMIDREFFHVAVVDLSLIPGRSQDRTGLMVLEWLRNLQEGTRSILVTGEGSMEVGFEVGVQSSTIGVAEKGKEDRPFDKQRFQKLFHDALDTACQERTRVLEKSHDMEVEMLLGDRPIYLWEDDVSRAVGNIQLIHTLLYLLFEPLSPLLPLGASGASVIDAKEHLVRCTLWSRMLGQAVSLVFGRKVEVDRVRASLPADTELVVTRERLDLAGFAIVNSSLEFSNFKSRLKAVAKPAQTQRSA